MLGSHGIMSLDHWDITATVENREKVSVRKLSAQLASLYPYRDRGQPFSEWVFQYQPR